MKIRRAIPLFALILWCTVPAWPQPASKNATNPLDEVLATINGVEYTARTVRRLRSYVPPGLAASLAEKTNREFLLYLHQLISLAETAKKERLLEREPYKSQWEFMQLNFLTNAYANEMGRTLRVADEEVRKYYEEQLAKGAYGSVRVSAIYVNYSPSAGGAAAPDGKTTLSEGQARGKAEELLTKLRAGADFAALAREHSDDKSSAEKGGDLGVFSKESRIPAAVKTAVLGLKTGALSELVQAGGTFYIFKATDSTATPFDEVKGKIETRLRSVMLFRKTQEAQAAIPIEFTGHPMLEERPIPPKTAK